MMAFGKCWTEDLINTEEKGAHFCPATIFCKTEQIREKLSESAV